MPDARYSVYSEKQHGYRNLQLFSRWFDEGLCFTYGHEDGFEYQGERYSSLSTLTRLITGTNWNGFLFFGLKHRSRRKTSETMESA